MVCIAIQTYDSKIKKTKMLATNERFKTGVCMTGARMCVYIKLLFVIIFLATKIHCFFAWMNQLQIGFVLSYSKHILDDGRFVSLSSSFKLTSTKVVLGKEPWWEMKLTEMFDHLFLFSFFFLKQCLLRRQTYWRDVSNMSEKKRKRQRERERKRQRMRKSER